MREIALLALAVAAGACTNPSRPAEADPAKVQQLAQTMLRNVPVPAGARDCKFEEVLGGATLTRRTLLELAHEPIGTKAEVAAWINPPELDSPAARLILDGKDEVQRRRAAAELLAAPFYLVYHIDLVDAPIALGVKDFKRPTVGARAIRYDKTGHPACILVFTWGQDPAKYEWSVKKTDRPLVDPAVQKAMQDDLAAQMLKRIAGLAAPPPPSNLPADTRYERQHPERETP
ncbi:MAG TPA: hypothetical protein VFQ53_02905 [Kofleriaceae bacterium]|nr:hypothetical protein [Kofleriaceae bacterium]